MMLWKNRNKKVGLCVMVVTAFLVLATLWVVLATPETALAKKPVKPPGTTIYFDVLLGMDGGDIFMVSGSGIEGRIESIGGGTNIDRMIVNRPSPHIDITSVIDEVAKLDPQGAADCFGDLWDDTLTGYIGVKGTLLIELPDRTEDVMTVAYGFIAKDTRGKEVPYTISTTGTLVETGPDGVTDFGDEVAWAAVQDAVNDGTADPEVIPDFFVQVAEGTLWTLSKSGSQKFACTGSDTFVSGFGIRITRPRTTKENSTLSP